MPNHDQIKHHDTKICETRHRNEDLEVIYAKNLETILNQKPEKSQQTHQTQKEAKFAKKILNQTILSEYQPQSENISNSQQKLADFRNEIVVDKKAYVKK